MPTPNKYAGNGEKHDDRNRRWRVETPQGTMTCWLTTTAEGVRATGELAGDCRSTEFAGHPLAGDGSESDARIRRYIGRLLFALHRGEKAPAA